MVPRSGSIRRRDGLRRRMISSLIAGGGRSPSGDSLHPDGCSTPAMVSPVSRRMARGGRPQARLHPAQGQRTGRLSRSRRHQPQYSVQALTEGARPPRRRKNRPPVSSRTVVIAVVAGAIILGVTFAMAIGARTIRQQSAEEPVTYEQLWQALAPGHMIGASKLTVSNQVPSDSLSSGMLCTHKPASVSSAAVPW
jgi:hypothetical protein